MVKLGEISFAFYLWHLLVLTYGDYWLGEAKTYSTPVAIAIIVGMFAVSLALAYLLFTYVEDPIMRRWARSRRPRPVVAALPSTTPRTGPEEIKRAS